jgi:excisionase family DNA binding protein
MSKSASASHVTANGAGLLEKIHEALPELFTLAEAAKKLRMGQSTLRGLARRGDIGHARSGKRLVFTPADLSTYLSRHRVEAKV